MTGTANLKMTLAPVRSVRHVKLTQSRMQMHSMYSNNIESTLECGTYTDTCYIGRHTLILNDYDRPVTVYGYDPLLGSKTFRTVSAVMSYRDPMTGTTYHLVTHQSIEIPHLDHHLLRPMQCQLNDVMINDTPNFLNNDPTPNTHAIVINIKDYDAENDNLIWPLSLKVVTSYLPVHIPTK